VNSPYRYPSKSGAPRCSRSFCRALSMYNAPCICSGVSPLHCRSRRCIERNFTASWRAGHRRNACFNATSSAHNSRAVSASLFSQLLLTSTSSHRFYFLPRTSEASIASRLFRFSTLFEGWKRFMSANNKKKECLDRKV